MPRQSWRRFRIEPRGHCAPTETATVIDLTWLPDLLERLALGAVGGLVAYVLAQRRFLTERRWDRLYELYCDVFDTLNAIEHSLTNLGGELERGPDARQGRIAVEAAASFEASLLKLNQFQERLMLLGAQKAHMKLMVLCGTLGVFRPSLVIGNATLDHAEMGEIRDLIKASRREASGRNGELAFLAQRDLRLHSSSRLRRWRPWWSRRGKPHAQ